ncbi:Uncharacterised protein [Mycobacteroides abscessus subsp. abscessus]|nr:Uncharacterised protein [Mycobacteroides abscessus subsp. abscessus]SKU06380.1 Uncharacterised protein [Mycobacteroides abscessus subsp. abscessus]
MRRTCSWEAGSRTAASRFQPSAPAHNAATASVYRSNIAATMPCGNADSRTSQFNSKPPRTSVT